MKKGFTLVETLVAVSILTLAIAGPLAVSSLAISESQHARNQITASYLAEEAQESIRNIRDSNLINGLDWLTGFDNCISKQSASDQKHCSLSANNLTPASCGVTTSTDTTTMLCPKMSLSNGFYSYIGNESIFNRDIKIRKVGTADNDILISVTMTWNEANGFQTYILKSYLNKLQ